MIRVGHVLLTGGIVFVVGLVVLFGARDDAAHMLAFGFGDMPAYLFFVTPRSLAGYGISVAGALAMAGALGYRIGRRHTPSGSD